MDAPTLYHVWITVSWSIISHAILSGCDRLLLLFIIQHRELLSCKYILLLSLFLFLFSSYFYFFFITNAPSEPHLQFCLLYMLWILTLHSLHCLPLFYFVDLSLSSSRLSVLLPPLCPSVLISVTSVLLTFLVYLLSVHMFPSYFAGLSSCLLCRVFRPLRV